MNEKPSTQLAYTKSDLDRAFTRQVADAMLDAGWLAPMVTKPSGRPLYDGDDVRRCHARLKAQEYPKPPPKGEWMQSLLHDQAHFVQKDGTALCNARTTAGTVWHPWSHHVTQCTRCRGHLAGNAKGLTAKPKAPTG